MHASHALPPALAHIHIPLAHPLTHSLAHARTQAHPYPHTHTHTDTGDIALEVRHRTKTLRTPLFEQTQKNFTWGEGYCLRTRTRAHPRTLAHIHTPRTLSLTQSLMQTHTQVIHSLALEVRHHTKTLRTPLFEHTPKNFTWMAIAHARTHSHTHARSHTYISHSHTLSLTQSLMHTHTQVIHSLALEVRHHTKTLRTPLFEQTQKNFTWGAITCAASVESFYRSALNSLLNWRLTGTQDSVWGAPREC